MKSKIVLISDDLNFFDYITPNISLRKSDELFRYTFDDIPNILHLLKGSVLVINSENTEYKTIELLNITKDCPCVIFAYNNNPEFEINVYSAGAYAYITPFMPAKEIQAKFIHVFSAASNIAKTKLYRELLEHNNLIIPNNEVFIDYKNMIEQELQKIQIHSESGVLVAIAPNDKSKFLLKSNQIETLILNNIRQNDILMNYAPNKYFLLLYNIDIENAKKIWTKICTKVPEKIYAGFANISSKNREQLINEALNNLHLAINYDKEIMKTSSSITDEYTGGNFKLFKQEFNKKVSQIISPVFYHIQQIYSDKLFGVSITHSIDNGLSKFNIQNKTAKAVFAISAPGCTKINIDINYKAKNIPAKHISLKPTEFDAGILEGLLEQFIEEFKKEIDNGNT